MSAVNYDKWNLIAESDEEDLQKNRNTLESLKTGADEIFNSSQNSDDFKRSLDMYKSVVRNINPPIEKSTIYVPCLLNICCCYTKLNEVDLCLSMIEDILQLTTLSNEERVRCHYFKVICVIKGKLDHLVWTAMNSCEHIETFLESRPDQILGSYNEFFGMKKQIQNQLEKIGTREQFIRKAKLIVEACQKYVRNGKIPPETSDALNGVEVVCRKLAKEEDMYTLLEEILHVKCDDVMRTGNLLEVRMGGGMDWVVLALCSLCTVNSSSLSYWLLLAFLLYPRHRPVTSLLRVCLTPTSAAMDTPTTTTTTTPLWGRATWHTTRRVHVACSGTWKRM